VNNEEQDADEAVTNGKIVSVFVSVAEEKRETREENNDTLVTVESLHDEEKVVEEKNRKSGKEEGCVSEDGVVSSFALVVSHSSVDSHIFPTPSKNPNQNTKIEENVDKEGVVSVVCTDFGSCDFTDLPESSGCSLNINEKDTTPPPLKNKKENMVEGSEKNEK
jgi:hypothetical protein